MRKAVLFVLSSPLLIGVALAGTGGSLLPNDGLSNGLSAEILHVARMIAHALGLL